MVGSTPFRGGFIPLEVMGSYAASVRDAAQGAVKAVAGAVDLSDEIQRVRAVGTKAEMEDGVKRFRSEVMEEFRTSGEPDGWEERWNHAVDNRLGTYLPESRPGVDDRELNEYVRRVKEEGAGEVRRMAQLEGISLARESWERKMARAGDSGDESEMERGMEEGRGIFIPEKDSPAYLEHAKERASLARVERDARQGPLNAEKSLKDGSHSFSEDETKATKLLGRVEGAVSELKGKYGGWMLDVTLQGGFVEDGALENAGKAGLLTPSQVRNYRDFVARERDAVWSHRQPDASFSELCDWRRRIDERSKDEECSLMLDLACSGLPRAEVVALSDRLKKTALIPEEARRKFSTALTALYNEGAWGARGDDSALKEWRRSQDAVLNALASNHDGGEAAAQRLLEEERNRQISSWVTYGEMKKSR